MLQRLVNLGLEKMCIYSCMQNKEDTSCNSYKDLTYIFFLPSQIHPWTLHFTVRLTFDVPFFTFAFDCLGFWLEEGFKCLKTTVIFENGATGDWRTVNRHILKRNLAFYYYCLGLSFDLWNVKFKIERVAKRS